MPRELQRVKKLLQTIAVLAPGVAPVEGQRVAVTGDAGEIGEVCNRGGLRTRPAFRACDSGKRSPASAATRGHTVPPRKLLATDDAAGRQNDSQRLASN